MLLNLINMKKFTLNSSYFVEEDLEANVCLKPSDPSIEEFIKTCKVFTDEATAVASITEYITQMTPLLFAEFQLMENVPLELRNQFEL